MVFACRRRACSPGLDGAGEELGADLAATDELDVELDDAMDADLAEVLPEVGVSQPPSRPVPNLKRG